MHCVKLPGQRLAARGFDRQLAEFQVRVAVLSGFTALGTPITETVGSLPGERGTPPITRFVQQRLVDTYNHARRLKTLKGLTPAQFFWKEWQAKPELFYEEPCHLTSGLYT